MELDQAIAILNQAPTILLFNDDFAEACKLAVQAMAEKVQKEKSVETREETAKSRRMRDLSLVTGILTSCSEQVKTVELFIEALPPEVVKELREAEGLMLKARDSAVREFSRLEPPKG